MEQAHKASFQSELGHGVEMRGSMEREVLETYHLIVLHETPGLHVVGLHETTQYEIFSGCFIQLVSLKFPCITQDTFK